MDPAVQVALVSVFATLVTTLGVVAVAVINKRSTPATAADPDMDLDANELLERLFAMAAENQRKEATIQKLKAQINDYKRRIAHYESLLYPKGMPHERHNGGGARGSHPGDAQQEPDLE